MRNSTVPVVLASAINFYAGFSFGLVQQGSEVWPLPITFVKAVLSLSLFLLFDYTFLLFPLSIPF
jgi:hypothetical protein